MPIVSAIARQWNFESSLLALTVNRRGDWIMATIGDGSARLLPASDEAEQPKIVHLHDGVSLSLQPDADDHAFLSGGDDGKIFIVEPEVNIPTLLTEQKGQWIDHVASSPEGWRAYATGKSVYLIDSEGKNGGPEKPVPSSVGGLAFSPNSKRLAVSHYNGVSLLWVNAKESEPVQLDGRGSFLSLLWHPESKMIMAAMQDDALHGWRLTDNAEMHMQGYATKIHSMAFTARAKYLATSGAESVICWPFFGGGPWEKTPLSLGGSEGRFVTCVAPHPRDEMVVAGYNDGMIIMSPLDGRMEVMIHPPLPGAKNAVTGLVWNAEGDCFFAALENGSLMLFTLASVAKAVKSGM